MVSQTVSQTAKVPSGDASLDGDLTLPAGARGVVLFAHGSGSSRLSPRNRAVAAGLRRAGFGTLLLDLLTEDEEREDTATARHRFDIALLTRRLADAVDWLERRPDTADLSVGLFGASTGAAAALAAAAHRPKRVSAVVSRGGRPDLAGDALPLVTARSCSSSVAATRRYSISTGRPQQNCRHPTGSMSYRAPRTSSRNPAPWSR